MIRIPKKLKCQTNSDVFASMTSKSVSVFNGLELFRLFFGRGNSMRFRDYLVPQMGLVPPFGRDLGSIFALLALIAAAGCRVNRPSADHAGQQMLYVAQPGDPRTFNPIL